MGSILIYATSNDLPYVDALVFASGANTQAGLNTVDVNKLKLFQQIVIYVLLLISNPITIHSSVVFMRLYWFEKRFQHIAQEARRNRVTIAKSRSKAKPSEVDVERGVNGRDITVIHESAKPSTVQSDGSVLDDRDVREKEGGSTTSSSNDPPPRPSVPAIKFSDQVKRSDRPTPATSVGDDDDDDDEDDDHIPLPRKRSDAEHIAILERQRQDHKGVLRIPGPRDVERGVGFEEFNSEEPTRLLSRERRRQSSSAAIRPKLTHTISHPDRQQTITIQEPVRPSRDQHNATNATQETADDGGIRFRDSMSQDKRLHRTDTGTVSESEPANRLQRIRTALTHRDYDDMPYLSWQPTVGRNSAFVGLTEEQREELGGIEYRSLKTLAVFLLVYFWGFTLISIVTMVPWIVHDNDRWGRVVDEAGVSRVWWGFFTANSGLMDLGFTLTPDSMISFNTATFPLVVMSFLIIIGNTGFPIMLRFMIWVTSLFAPRGSGLWEELRFLLDHPRRCFTLLFPSNATWWLFFIVVALNLLDVILFIALDVSFHPATPHVDTVAKRLNSSMPQP